MISELLGILKININVNVAVVDENRLLHRPISLLQRRLRSRAFHRTLLTLSCVENRLLQVLRVLESAKILHQLLLLLFLG